MNRMEEKYCKPNKKKRDLRLKPSTRREFTGKVVLPRQRNYAIMRHIIPGKCVDQRLGIYSVEGIPWQFGGWERLQQLQLLNQPSAGRPVSRVTLYYGF
jgi:hypothetical protein